MLSYSSTSKHNISAWYVFYPVVYSGNSSSSMSDGSMLKSFDSNCAIVTLVFGITPSIVCLLYTSDAADE